MNYRTITIGLLILVGLGLTTSVFAASWWPIVPCGYNTAPTGGDPSINYTKDCSVCDFFRLAKNIIDFILYGLVPPVAVLLFIIAGGLILIGGAYPKNVTLGRKIFSNTAVGLLIVFGSWMIANTLIKSFAPDKIATSWFKLECKENSITPTPSALPTLTSGNFYPNTNFGGGRSGGGGASKSFGNYCTDLVALAKSNNVPYPAKDSEALKTLKECMRSKLPSNLIGSVVLYTYDQSNYICNFTRGNKTCTSVCSHSVNSCHYGGTTGKDGAEAVDFSFVKNTKFTEKDGEEEKEVTLGEKIYQAAKDCGAKFYQCEKSGKKVDCSDSGVDHVHASSKSCGNN